MERASWSQREATRSRTRSCSWIAPYEFAPHGDRDQAVGARNSPDVRIIAHLRHGMKAAQAFHHDRANRAVKQCGPDEEISDRSSSDSSGSSSDDSTK